MSQFVSPFGGIAEYTGLSDACQSSGEIDSTDVHLTDKGHISEFFGIREGGFGRVNLGGTAVIWRTEFCGVVRE
jgi:hypothetical protein